MPDPNWIACYETKITGFVAVFGDLNHAGKYNKSYYLALLGKPETTHCQTSQKFSQKK